MWYFIWFIGLLLACSFAIITGMKFESLEEKHNKADKE